MITFSYDDQGKVIDVALDDSSGGAPAEMLKQIMTRAFATVAPMTLSVGESVTVPTALNLPLPAGGPAVPMGIQGETRYTLTSVTFDGADRIAHLTSHTTNTINRGSPSSVPAGSPFALAMTMTGDGKSDVNVDRGIVLHAEQQATIEASMRGPATEQQIAEHAHARDIHDRQRSREVIVGSRNRRERCGSGGYVRLPAFGVGGFSSRRMRDEEVIRLLSKHDATARFWHRSCIAQWT